MEENLNIFLSTYQKDKSTTVDSSKEYYQAIKNVKNQFQSIINNENYLAKFSCGNANKAEIPWLCIFNTAITTSAQKGIYIAYLFKKDMSGFYLTLNQGITSFKNNYKEKKYEYAEKVADYFKTLITTNHFSKGNIYLNNKSGSLGYGYEKTNIISKFYEKNNFSEKELISDFIKMLKIYNNICTDIKSIDEYEYLIKNIIKGTAILSKQEDATKQINEILDNDEKLTKDVFLSESQFPKTKDKKPNNVNRKKYRKKVDGIKKASRDVKIGLQGESHVLKFEKDRIKSLGRNDLAESIEWVSEFDDTLGYDIISYDIDKSGKEHKIYIEVKTTEGTENTPFFLSKNELETMEECKDNYWIYRVYNSNTSSPQFFKIGYNEFKEKIKLTTYTYLAEIS